MLWDQQGQMPNQFAPRLSATPPPRGNIGPPIQQFGRPVGPQPFQTQMAQLQQGQPPRPDLLNNAPMPWQKPPMQGGGMLGTPPPGMGGGMPGAGQIGPGPMPVRPQPMGQGQMPTQQMPMPGMGRPPGM